MLNSALMCLVVALIAGVLSLAGVSTVALEISRMLFVVAILLLVIHWLMGRRARPV